MGTQLQMLCSVRSSPELRCVPAMRACIPTDLMTDWLAVSKSVGLTNR